MTFPHCCQVTWRQMWPSQFKHRNTDPLLHGYSSCTVEHKHGWPGGEKLRAVSTFRQKREEQGRPRLFRLLCYRSNESELCDCFWKHHSTWEVREGFGGKDESLNNIASQGQQAGDRSQPTAGRSPDKKADAINTRAVSKNIMRAHTKAKYEAWRKEGKRSLKEF